ncbi:MULTISPECIES: cytochrome b [Pseudomonas]|jgi:cytochrome b561|uniref:cytochrome b n=1 Tax=Pseudomonas TaxID=286 RepID=UPI000484D799|nr:MULTISPECIES: cytochrome b [Pseudomonas]MBF6037440.1 cytochrome b [Pseudomonas mucoides]
MTRDSAAPRYGKLSMIMHWLMLGLFVGVYTSIELKGMLPRGHALKGLFLGLHGLFGLSIFILVWVRLLGRLTPRPPITPALPLWQTGISHLMHLALYGLMIATPLLAWLMLSAGGKPMPYFGFYLPSLVAVDPDLARQFKHWHELLGSAGYWLIGLHAAAGLFHHYWVRDNTLTRMLPGRSGNAVNQRQR